MACPSCFSGGITALAPTGTETTIHGLPTYVASPEGGVTPKGLIVVITDAFGWEFVNNRVLCDQYAKKGGWLVYCPDFMAGKAMSPLAIPLMDKLTTPSPTWLSALLHKPLWAIQVLCLAIPWKSACAPEKTHPGVLAFFQALRTSAPPFPSSSSPNLKIGVAGFCWGGKHAFLLAQDKEGDRVVRWSNENEEGNGKGKEALIDCVFTAHPSYIDVPGEVEDIVVPMSVIVGDADMALKKDVAELMQNVLEKKSGGGQGKHEMVILEGAKHGFAIRTHPDDEVEMGQAMKAEEQALGWFEKWMSG